VLAGCAAAAPAGPATPPAAGAGSAERAVAAPPVAEPKPAAAPAPRAPAAAADRAGSWEAALAAAQRYFFAPPDLSGREPLGLWATYYYIPQVTHEQEGHALRDPAGHELGPKLSLRDWCEAALQGTVLVSGPGSGGDAATAVTYNFAGTRKNTEVDCSPIYPRYPAISRTRFHPAGGPHGDGVLGMILIPFRSIAVDPAVIPTGSLVYIPAARGTRFTLPSGEPAVHDGFFFAADRGGAIKDNHIDVFIGAAEHNPFAFVRSRRRPELAAYVIAEPDSEPARILARAHRYEP